VDGPEERIVEKLIEVYSEQDSLYQKFIALSRELVELAQKETPPDRITRLVTEREACLTGISKLEKSIDREKEIWQNKKGDLPGDQQRLKELVDKIRGYIEQSLELDKQIEADIQTSLGSLKSDLDHLKLTRKAQKAYLKRNDGPQTGITRARA